MLLRRSSWFIGLVALGGLGGAAACGDDTTPSSPSTPAGHPSEAVLSARSQVMSPAVSNAAVVEADRLLLPASFRELLDKKPGDILIAERQQPAFATGHNPTGFLRKVRWVRQEGDRIVVGTEAPALTEAFDRLAFKATIDSSVAREIPDELPGAPGATPQKVKQGKPIELINFSGKSLFDVKEGINIDGKNIGFQAFAKVDTGFVKFSPSYDIDADISKPKLSLDGIELPKLNSFHASATGTLDAQLVLDAGIKLDTDIDSATFTKIIAQKIFKAKDANLADINLDLGSIQAGPLSISINGNFKAVLACDFDWKGGAQVKYGGKASASITAGLKYENDKIEPIFDKSASFEQIGPDWTLNGLVKVKCSVSPTIQLKLWDLGSAEVWAKAYAGIGGSLTCGAPSGNPPTQNGTIKGSAVAGVRAGLKANLNLLGLVKYNKECVLFDLNASKDYEKTFALPGGGQASCAGADLPFNLGEPAPDASKCFGSGGGSSGSGGASGNEIGGNCKPGLSNVAAGWTCDIEKWNDCKCDCDCGVKDVDCANGECSECGHDVCTIGDKLGPKCGECAKKICAKDEGYCCEETWGASCVQDAKDLCGMCGQ